MLDGDTHSNVKVTMLKPTLVWIAHQLSHAQVKPNWEYRWKYVVINSVWSMGADGG